MVAPPTLFGANNADLRAACHELGVQEVYRVGGAQGVAMLIDQIRQERISTYFIENSNDPRLVNQIAEATGAKDGSGTVVVTVPTAQGNAAARDRVRWAVAEWAVANVSVAPVQQVATEGKVWRSADPSKGWVPDAGQAEPNRVTITLS